MALLLLIAGLLSGCAASEPPAPGDPASGTSPATEPSGEAPIVFEGRFTGVSVAGEAFTSQSDGIRWFDVPPGNPEVRIEVAWTGTSPTGVSLSVSGGDGTPVFHESFQQESFLVTLPPGKLPSGEANLLMGPARDGASSDVRYEVAITFVP